MSESEASVTDTAAVRRCQKGDRDAFAAMIERHRSVLFGTAYLMTRDRQMAEDAVQEALVRVWQHIGSLRNPLGLKAWLVRIVVNEVRQLARKKTVATLTLEELPDPPGDAGATAIAGSEIRQDLARAVALLPPDQREVVVLRFFSELTVPEIATATGWRQGTVKSRLSRAMDMLREMLHGYEDGGGEEVDMDSGLLQQELQRYFQAEVQAVEPASGWWANAVARASQRPMLPSLRDRLRAVFSSPVWAAAIPVAVVLIVAGGLLATGVLPGLFSRPASTTLPPPATTAPPKPLLKVTATTGRASYLPGENVEIRFSLTNITNEAVTLSHFANAEITRSGTTVRSLEGVVQGVKLAPDESTAFNLMWDQLDTAGKPVEPAVYQLSLENVDITKGSPPVSTRYSFHEVGQVNIVFPQGVMEKVIEVNQSQSADGITMTIERVELLRDKMKVYVLKTPGYAPSQPGRPEPPSLAGRAEIEGTYSIDNGPPLSLGAFGYRTVEGKGVEYIWEDLYPVPSDAHALSFRITRFATVTGSSITDNDGPWEFRIQLQ